MNTPRAHASLHDFKTAAFAHHDIGSWDADVFEMHLAMPRRCVYEESEISAGSLQVRQHIIITSRNPQYQYYNTVGFQEVAQLSSQDSILLLIKVVYGESDSVLDTSKERKIIVEVLGDHALAIALAGAYIRETSYSLSDYLEIY
jgi:hypothetical protein